MFDSDRPVVKGNDTSPAFLPCDIAELRHTTLAIARLRFLFLAAKIWKHAGRVGISYSDQYPERGLFQRLMELFLFRLQISG